MGAGKTCIAIAAALMAGRWNILVIAPPHLVQKWKREIEMTIPRAQPVRERTLADLQRLRTTGSSRNKPRFTILSRETAKLSHHWQAAYVNREARDQDRRRVHCCPDCFAKIRDRDNVPRTPAGLECQKHRCRQCQGALWIPQREGHRNGCPCRSRTGLGRANSRNGKDTETAVPAAAALAWVAPTPGTGSTPWPITSKSG